MLTTFDRETWKEPADIDQIIESMRNGTPSPEELRRIFPYRGVVKKRLIPYGVPEGAVLNYIRIRHEPSLYPFVGIIGVGGETEWGNYGRRLILDGNEIQVIEA